MGAGVGQLRYLGATALYVYVVLLYLDLFTVCKKDYA